MKPDLGAALIDGMSRYPDRLQHHIPGWVESGAIYHIRIRTDTAFSNLLTDQNFAAILLKSAVHYHCEHRWACFLFLLMPDHLHALLAFRSNEQLGSRIGAWKAYHSKHSQILWQKNFFDHRIRNEEELAAKSAYIRNNPVAKGVCQKAEDWPWLYSGSP